MSADLSNEQQRAELEAASLRFVQLFDQYAALQASLENLQTAVGTKVVLLDTEAQVNPDANSQLLSGRYLFGSETDPSLVNVGSTPPKEAHVIFGPTSTLTVRCIPKESYHAVPKAYVDNIVSPLYTQLSRALSTKLAVFVTMRKAGGYTDLTLGTNTVLSASLDYTSIFTLDGQSVTFALGGTYQISWDLASPNFSSLMSPTLLLNGQEIGKMYLSGAASGTISLVITVNNGSTLSWFSTNAPFSTISNALSIIRLGD